MKRTFLLALMVFFFSCGGFAQHIERLNKAEIDANPHTLSSSIAPMPTTSFTMALKANTTPMSS